MLTVRPDFKAANPSTTLPGPVSTTGADGEVSSKVLSLSRTSTPVGAEGKSDIA